MATVKDICRICLQEADYDEIQEIDVRKLKALIKKSLLPKWDLPLFRNHIICDACINNFRTLRNLHRLSWSANAQLMRLRRTLVKGPIDLKQLSKFQHAQGDFFVCRLCLEPTKHVAIYLFNNPCNIVPWVFISMMLKSAHLYMSLLDKTVNPVLCYQCWQRIQVSFSFRKHLDMVTEKFQYYQEMRLETYVNRENLQDMLQVWDTLGTESIPQFEKVIQHDEISMRPTNIPCLKQENNDNMFFEEHNYCSKSVMRNSIDSESTETCSSIDVGVDEMPCLMPSVADEEAKEVKALNLSVWSLRDRQQINYGELDRRLNLTKLSKKKGGRPKKPIIVNGHDGKMEKLVGILKSKAQKNKQRVDSNVEINRTFRRMTRLSARKEDLGETDSQDLLVLKKEVIIKEKPFKKPKVTLPSPKSKKSSPKKCSNNEYTFESLCFDKEAPSVNQAAIEEEKEVQIKKEVVSDSDDDFMENVANIDDNGIENLADQCPNLDVFIKSEPEEVVGVNSAEDEPPELEFQGPCNYDPTFVISNAFSVNDKRQVIINTAEEKGDLLTASSSTNPGNVSPQNSLLKKPLLPKENNVSTGNNYYKPLYQEVVINLSKCDKKAVLQFETLKPSGVETRKRRSNLAKVAPPVITQLEPNRRQIISNVVPALPSQPVLLQTEAVGPSNVRQRLPLPATLRQFANGSEAIHSNGHNQSLNDYYSEIDVSPIDIANPFKCRMCDFVTPHRRAAKCHVALHTTNLIHLYACKVCSYQTTTKNNLRRHYQRKHEEAEEARDLPARRFRSVRARMTCMYCNLVGSEAKCSKCPGWFHANCLLENYGIGAPGCSHLRINGCMTISVDGQVKMTGGKTRGKKKETSECDYCMKYVQNFINCEQCKRYFHYKCFFLSRVKGPDRCLHRVVPVLIKNPLFDSTSSGSQGNGKEESRKCDYCYGVVDSVIPCPNCLKFMHHACFVRDSTERKFNCRHTDIVGGPPAECAYCGIIAERTGVTCRLCNQTLHRVCLVRSEKRFNCEHTDVQPITKENPNLNNGDGFNKMMLNHHSACHGDLLVSDTQTPLIPDAIASTSKGLKRETLDLSDFIMLCE